MMPVAMGSIGKNMVSLLCCGFVLPRSFPDIQLYAKHVPKEKMRFSGKNRRVEKQY